MKRSIRRYIRVLWFSKWCLIILWFGGGRYEGLFENFVFLLFNLLFEGSSLVKWDFFLWCDKVEWCNRVEIVDVLFLFLKLKCFWSSLWCLVFIFFCRVWVLEVKLVGSKGRRELLMFVKIVCFKEGVRLWRKEFGLIVCLGVVVWLCCFFCLMCCCWRIWKLKEEKLGFIIIEVIGI